MSAFDAYDDDGNLVGDDYGMLLLDDICELLFRYVAFPSTDAAVAVTLWIAHSYVAEQFYVTPRLILESAEPESGKTRVLELLALLCRNPKMTFNTTVAALYRRMQDDMLTVLLDEADAVFNAKAGPQAEDLRALINAGYKRGATVDRCVGDGAKMAVKEFSVFAPMAIAGLAGKVPYTVTSRGVQIMMRRRAPGESVDDYQEEDVLDVAAKLRHRLETWTESVSVDLRAARPKMPDGVRDRKAECWRALLAVADTAGGAWPEFGRAACEHFTLGGGAKDVSELSAGIRLLADIRTVWGSATSETSATPLISGVADVADVAATAALLRELWKLDESPWGEWYGKPLGDRQLAKLLKPYDIRPVVVRIGQATPRGYKLADFTDAWKRYL
jgi:Protein of unknown function (DUF3631)